MDTCSKINLNTARTVLYRNAKCFGDCNDSSHEACSRRSGCPSQPRHAEFRLEITSSSPKSLENDEESSIQEEEGEIREDTKHPDSRAINFSTNISHNNRGEPTRECANPGRCYQCRDLVDRVRNLLDEIKAIKKQESPGVCDYCNKITTTGNCKRCEFLANRYKISENIRDEYRVQKFKIWLCKVKQFLYSILERETCKYHKSYAKTPATDELTNLLQELKTPLNRRQQEIGLFPSIDSLENITESKDILEQVLERLKSVTKDKLTLPQFELDPQGEISFEKNEVIFFERKEAKYLKRDKKSKDISGKARENKFSTENIKMMSTEKKESKVLEKDKKSKNISGKEREMRILPENKEITSDVEKLAKELKKGKQAKGISGKEVQKEISSERKESLYAAEKEAKELEKYIKGRGKEREKMSVPKKKDSSSTEKKGAKESDMTKKDIVTSGKGSMKTKESSEDDKKSKENRKDKFKGDQKSLEKNKTNKDDKKIKDDKRGSQTLPKNGKSEDALIKQLMKLKPLKPEVVKDKDKKQTTLPKLPDIAPLPTIVRKAKEQVIQPSESSVECDIRVGEEESEMVKGNIIVPFKSRKPVDTGPVEPLLFEVHIECPSVSRHEIGSNAIRSTSSDNEKKKAENVLKSKGVISYVLSDREFIKKGWTLLPTTKIMRRMNIYKMVPANLKTNWFERHRDQGLVLYDTGEKFAEIQKDGSGKWFYKNGMVALDYYCSKDSDVGHRYVVYSSCEEKDGRLQLPVTILATFDHHGNGVVYDHYGNERLKYNQSEGVVIDEKIGPAAKWKWHTLNDPPVLQKVFVDTRLRATGHMANLHNDINADPGSKLKEPVGNLEGDPNQAMLQIELDNFIKEKAHKLLQEFKPFHIKMKACKVNDQFSLKVLDQANIYLMFRDGHTSAKLNLGMVLISNEIVDTHTAEVTTVETPYDLHPPKSESIADIQAAIEKARQLGKARGKLRI